mgnify:CR=1 FL=1
MDFRSSDILLPRQNFEKWSTVACDQYTSDAEYWTDVEKTVADSPSALRIMLPEIYLEEKNVDRLIEKTYEKMREYLRDGVFETVKDAYIYVERTLSDGKTRKGLMGIFDLEAYDFNAGSGSVIRATEGTVLSRIPPRVRIRQNACLEMPHIMILIDDRSKCVIEPLEEQKSGFEKLYDFDLMKNGGHIKGYKVSAAAKNSIETAIASLYDEKAFADKYGIEVGSKPLLVFAVGDGNHSLATAKTCWENIKKDLTEEEKLTHPARYALAELVNLHDTSLEFEPIHRVLFGVDEEKFVKDLETFFAGYKLREDEDSTGFSVLINGKEKHYVIDAPKSNLTVGDVQCFIDHYLKDIQPDAKVDYIHGEEEVKALAGVHGNVGILLPAMEKNDLFKTVILDGVLPRKTFSMGHANDKRYYLEVRKITPDAE